MTASSTVPIRVTLLPTADASSHTLQARLDLPVGIKDIAPGMFARVWLPTEAKPGSARVYVPLTAIARRAELTGLYVIDGIGRPSLRQVRLGPATGESIEVLSGLNAGELVAIDPQAAAKVR